MREIIFRGKRVDNGKWVEGCYVNHLTRMLCPIGDFLKEGDEKHYIVKSGFADWNMPRDLEFVEVIPETVGQYTGLTDKNCKKIFEGDVFKSDYYKDGRKFEVVFSDGAFCGKIKTTGMFPLGYTNDYYRTGDDDDDFCYPTDYVSHVEVVGNIYDNPELFENK